MQQRGGFDYNNADFVWPSKASASIRISPFPLPPHMPHHSGLFACRREKFWHQTDGFSPPSYANSSLMTPAAPKLQTSGGGGREGGKNWKWLTWTKNLENLNFSPPPPLLHEFSFLCWWWGGKKNFIYLLLFAAAAEQKRRKKRGWTERKKRDALLFAVSLSIRVAFSPLKQILYPNTFSAWHPLHGLQTARGTGFAEFFHIKNIRIKLSLVYLR